MDPAAKPRAAHRVLRTAALLALVGLAAHLRFSGLDWGHRHPMHTDERVFVENAVRMADTGDWDHHFYAYPGLFFYVLRGAVSLLSPEGRHTADAYVLCRAVVALFGVVNVALVAWGGARLVGVPAGLVAALLAAVSPVDVEASHEVRPDVVLQSVGLLGLLALARIGKRLRDDALMGGVIGLAFAVKYTGVLLAVPYLLRRALVAGPRVRGALAAGGVATLVAVAGTPQVVLDFDAFRSGPGLQLAKNYTREVTPALVAGNAEYYVRASARALGSLGAACAVLGAVLLVRRHGRLWLPAMSYPAVTVGAMATGSLLFQRFVLPSVDVLYVAAGAPFALLATGRWRSLGALALGLALAWEPLGESRGIVRVLSRPSAQDRAADWILAHVPAGSRILETRGAARLGATAGAAVGLPAGRYERLSAFEDEETSGLIPLLERHVDLVIVAPDRRWRELRTLYAAPDAHGRPALLLRTAREVPRYEEVAAERLRLAASGGAVPPDVMADGDADTTWTTSLPLRGGEWIQAELDRARPVGRIVILGGRDVSTYDPELQVLTSPDGVHYAPTSAIAARPPMREQHGGPGPVGMELLLRPRPVRALRIVQHGARPYRWQVAELVLEARVRDARWAAPGDTE